VGSLSQNPRDILCFCLAQWYKKNFIRDVGENYQIIATFEVDGGLPQKCRGSGIA
jgi:hypothetical protein